MTYAFQACRHTRVPCRSRSQWLHLEALEDRAMLSLYTVDHLAEDMVGDGFNGSLRYCITNATDGDSIQFSIIGTINLTRALPNLTHSISIEGPGPDLLTVRRDMGASYGIFAVLALGSVGIAGLGITNGDAPFGGGGIFNSGNLTVSNCSIWNNVAGSPYVDESGGGGGIFNSGHLTVSKCSILE